MNRTLGTIFLLLVVSAYPAHSLDVHKIRHKRAAKELPQTSIPRGAKTYSLFLICNPEWLGSDREKDLGDLHEKFEEFGNAIGSENYAIWFWMRVPPHPESARPKAKELDNGRMEKFCQAWNLAPSTGPYVVITASYPDERHLETTLSGDHAVIKLGGLQAAAITKILDKLTDDLVLQKRHLGEVNFEEAAPPPPDFWRRILQSAQTVVAAVQDSWSLSVDAGPVKAEVKARSKGNE